MLNLETKPRSYVAYSSSEIKEMLQIGMIKEGLPVFLKRHIDTGKLYLKENQLYRKKLVDNKDDTKKRYDEFPIGNDEYFVCLPHGPVTVMTLDQVKEQFNIVG